MTEAHPSERPRGTIRWRIALFILAGVLASIGVVAPTATGAWAASGLSYALKDGNSAGSPTYNFGFGPAGAMLPVVGDWNGDGTDTVGLSLPSGNGRRFVETNYNAGSAASADFGWGNAGCRPISGDWNGDGKDSVGEVCRNDASSTWRWVLTDYNQASGSDADFTYGNVSCSPVVGDWDGNGTTTIGVACKNGTGVTWSLRNANSSGAPNISFGWGSSTCTDITGNWDGNLNNTTTVGQTCASGGTWSWRLSNHNSGGGVDISFSYGATLGLPITGDWNGDGITSIGVVGGWSIGTTPPPSNPTGLQGAIVAKAQSQIGVSETGNDCNPYGPCESWCALFSTWVWRQAGVAIPSYGFTGDIYTWGQQHNLLRSLSQIQPGDMVLFGTGPQNSSTSVHVGIVEQVLSNGTIVSIEGNYSDQVMRVGPYSPSDPEASGWHDSPIYAVVAPA